MVTLPVPEIVQKMAAQIDDLTGKINEMGKRIDDLAGRVEALSTDSHGLSGKLDEMHASVTVCKDMLRTLNRTQDKK
jgi:peptidoglycan hydrolase CwlO-like protein